ncbi:MAG: hypothetical protein H2174_09405 [Vampirovibrio sp.]|jgi:hypothetical protein|nr:hypothetical protein [Vampirovibrio sp.]
MMMLTTQLAYNPSVSALAKPQERPNSSPTNTAAAIGLVETDSYKTGEQSPQVVGNPQARSGAFHMSGVFFLLLAGAAGFLVAQEPVRKTLGDFLRKMTGGNHKEASSHRSRADKPDYDDEIPNTLPTNYQEKTRHSTPTTKNNRRRKPEVAPAQEEAYA